MSLRAAFATGVLMVLPLAASAAPAPGYRVGASSAGRQALLAADESSWGKAPTIAWGPSPYETRFRALWGDDGLFLRFDATDSSPWHTMMKRDEHLWEEEVVEIFLDINRSGHDYAEIEISPGNVVCDVRMVSPWPNKQMDFAWNLEGIETRVMFSKDSAGKTTAWTAMAFLPWAGFRSLPSAKGIALPPKAEDAWRFNVFRVKRPGGKAAPEAGAVEVAWSPPPGESFHMPEAFRDFVFAPRRE
ncbi:MAG: carbohydrate-binding family 9-like protein [Vicinamibacteria bacterium]